MPLPDGYRQVPGSRRRFFRAPDGTVVTRTQAENIYAQSLGFRNDYHYKQYSPRVSRAKLARTQARKARERGVSTKQLRGLQAQEIREREEGIDTKLPGGSVHQIQVLLGNAGPADTDWLGSPSVRGIGG